MKTRFETSAEKQRGGFYTPDPLVDQALERVAELIDGARGLRVLEPSAGDGAFIRGLARAHIDESALERVIAVEVNGEEAARCRSTAATAGLEVEVVEGDFVKWQATEQSSFDVAVGNPPFVRFQFVEASTKAAASALTRSLLLPEKGVSNLWLPILLGAVKLLRPGGAFTFVVPGEFFTGVSAGVARSWLVRECDRLDFDLFPSGQFPGALQEVMVLSGRRGDRQSTKSTLVIHDHRAGGRHWSHEVTDDAAPWTRYLLSPQQLQAVTVAEGLACVRQLSTVATFEVAAVTGANSYFSVDPSTVDEFELGPWATPLLPRIRYAPGMVYTASDHADVSAQGVKSALLDFNASRPSPLDADGPREYIEAGEKAGLHQRFKTRTRSPWYRVPLVRVEPLMLSKRCHRHPRLVLNRAGAVTTDTIYRGWVTDEQISAEAITACFHNSLTLLSAEVEGRSFGGGVLELVPSEVARLRVPILPEVGAHLPRLDSVSRGEGEPAEVEHRLVRETNAILSEAEPALDADLLREVETARSDLAQRRFARNGRVESAAAAG